MTGEALGYLLQQIFQQKGILDAYYTSILMKKNRPGMLLTVLVRREDLSQIEDFLLIHSSSFGVRSYPVARQILSRKFVTYTTPWGEIQMKVGSYQGKVLKVTPEYEDIVKIAQISQRTFNDIYQQALSYAALVKEQEEGKL